MSPEDRNRPQSAAIVPPEPGTVADLFAQALPGVEIVATQGVKDVILIINRDDAHRLLQEARSNEKLAFEFLSSLCGVDYEEEGMEVVYHLYSYKLRHSVTVRAKVPTGDAHIVSVSDIWRTADWHERETRDMFGIVFDGHPNMVPILLPDDMLDHYPLRKDNPLAPLEEWQGMQLGDNIGDAGYIPPGSGIEVPASAATEEEAE